MLDMKSFLRRQDMVYEKAAAEWEQHIPMGNGSMGGALWGEGPLFITLDRYDVWENRSGCAIDREAYTYENLRRLAAEGNASEVSRIFEPELGALYQKGTPPVFPTKLPMGRAKIAFSEPLTAFRARLSLCDGTVTGMLDFPGGQGTFTAFLHACRDVLSVELHLPRGVEISFFGAEPVLGEVRKILKSWGYPEPEYGKSDGMDYWRQQIPEQGETCVIWAKEALPAENEGETALRLLWSTASASGQASCIEKAAGNLHEVLEADFEAIYGEHRDWWKEYWEKSLVSIPDPKLESLYYCELYKLGCAVRPHGDPVSLQGLWTKDGVLPPWNGDYHFDMNVQETYWCVYSSNRLELGTSLNDMLEKILPRMEEYCRDFYGCEGAMLPCAVAKNGQIIHGWHTVNLWLGNGLWAAHHLWLSYLYSKDGDFLREQGYPLMKKLMGPAERVLEKREDGLWHLPFGSSPEWRDNTLKAWGEDCSGDLALIRFLVDALLKSAEILGLSEEKKPLWEDIREHLAPFPTHTDWCGEGLSIQRGEPLSSSHRHHTHLMGIYPLDVLNIEQGEEAKRLIASSLMQWWRRGKGEWTGWSFPWAACICARAGYANAALHDLHEYMTGFILENTQHQNGDPGRHGIGIWDYRPMTVEAGFAVVAAVNELLLQSWGGVIRVFPHMPDVWRDVSFETLRAEGAFLVSASLRGGKFAYLRIESEAGGVCRVKNPYKGGCRLMSGGHEKMFSGELLSFETVPGGSYLLLPEDAAVSDGDFTFSPLPFYSHQACPFGLKESPSL